MNTKTRELTVLGLLISLMLVLGLVPNIGFITLGVVSVSIVHLPVVIGTVLLGWKRGLILAFAFGVISFARAFTPAGAADILFTNPLISILPRLSIGFATYGVFVFFKFLLGKLAKLLKKESAKTVKELAILLSIFTNIAIFYAVFFTLNSVAKIDLFISISIGLVLAAISHLVVYNAVLGRFENAEKTSIAFACAAGAFSNTLFTLLAFYFFVPIFFNDILVKFNLVEGKVFIAYLMGLAGTNGILELAFFVVIGTPIILALRKFTQKKEII